MAPCLATGSTTSFEGQRLLFNSDITGGTATKACLLLQLWSIGGLRARRRPTASACYVCYGGPSFADNRAGNARYEPAEVRANSPRALRPRACRPFPGEETTFPDGLFPRRRERLAEAVRMWARSWSEAGRSVEGGDGPGDPHARKKSDPMVRRPCSCARLARTGVSTNSKGRTTCTK